MATFWNNIHTVQCGRHVPSQRAASIFGTETTEVTGLSDTWAPTYQTTRRHFQYYVVLKHTAPQTLKIHTRNVSHTHTHIHYIYTYIYMSLNFKRHS